VRLRGRGRIIKIFLRIRQCSRFVRLHIVEVNGFILFAPEEISMLLFDSLYTINRPLSKIIKTEKRSPRWSTECKRIPLNPATDVSSGSCEAFTSFGAQSMHLRVSAATILIRNAIFDQSCQDWGHTEDRREVLIRGAMRPKRADLRLVHIDKGWSLKC
jgi:hypothetical protein